MRPTMIGKITHRMMLRRSHLVITGKCLNGLLTECYTTVCSRPPWSMQVRRCSNQTSPTDKSVHRTPTVGWKQYVQSIANNKEINTIPNIITMSRIVASPLLSLAIAYDMKAAALGGCILFGFTDWLDGYLAKKLNQQTVLGAFLDPMADKVMIGALTIGLVAKGLIPIELAWVILGRDLTLIAASFALRAMERPAGSHFFDTTDSATFNIVPSDLSKINTGVQFVLLSATLSNFAFAWPAVSYLEPLWWITATTTLASGALYLDGSGRSKITRSMKDKVVGPVVQRVKVVGERAKLIEQKVKQVIQRKP